jgi:hypothetical protein
MYGLKQAPRLWFKKLDTLDKVKEELGKRFKVKDVGPARYLLGLEIERDRPNSYSPSHNESMA